MRTKAVIGNNALAAAYHFVQNPSSPLHTIRARRYSRPTEGDSMPASFKFDLNSARYVVGDEESGSERPGETSRLGCATLIVEGEAHPPPRPRRQQHQVQPPGPVQRMQEERAINSKNRMLPISANQQFPKKTPCPRVPLLHNS